MIYRDARQSCVLSALPFMLYSEQILREALNDEEVRVKVNDEWINYIRCADDTILMADNIKDLQKLRNRIKEHGKTMGPNINSKRTKVLIVPRSQRNFLNASLPCDGKPLQRVNKFKYLGHGFVRNGNQTSKLRATLNRYPWHSKSTAR